MGLLKKLFGKSDSDALADYQKQAMAGMLGLPSSDGKIVVNHQTALGFSPWWAGLNIISNSIASMPIKLYERTEDGRNEASSNLSHILNRQINSFQNSFDVRKYVQMSASHTGNGYAIIERSNDLEVTGLIPIKPEQVLEATVETYKGYKVLVYTIRIETKGKEKKKVKYLGDDILHVKGLSDDTGIFGLDPIELFRGEIALGKSASQYAEDFFASGGLPLAKAEFIKHISNEDLAHMRRQINEDYVGKTKIATYRKSDMELTYFPNARQSNKDSELVAVKGLSVLEVCRILNLKPHQLADLTKSSYASIEAQGLEFLQYCLLPIMKSWEAEINNKLLTFEERQRGVYAEFLTASLLRADTESRYRSYQIGLNNFLTINEVRKLENLPSIGPAGDEIRVKLNTATPDQIAEESYSSPLLVDTCDRIDRRMAKSKEKDSLIELLKPIVAELKMSEDQQARVIDGYMAFSRPLKDVIREVMYGL